MSLARISAHLIQIFNLCFMDRAFRVKVLKVLVLFVRTHRVMRVWGRGGIGRRRGLKILRLRSCGFESHRPHQLFSFFLPYFTCRNASILIRKYSSRALSVAKCKKAGLTGAITLQQLTKKFSCDLNVTSLMM